ncbi:sensor histidine kinase [Alteromonas facilis]|uniref:sensor histidine kinase n=1 Tax=Alteromonas facilis TaxID=2048004 RepID=UPI000C288C28|nr:HAMP domain-containing sensor histidine kinase [Alteromonas facilis]
MSKEIDFSSVLAAAVHDMKNSLNLLIQTLESLDDTIPKENKESREYLSQVHYESARLNTGLVQMLSLYRAEINGLPLNIDEHVVEDLIIELVGANQTYSQQRKIEITTEYDESLTWFFDKDLVFLLLNDVLINAMRYGNKHIHLSANVVDNKLIVTIEDDGPGYPENMLEQSLSELAKVSVSQGRTGLGIFFARMIAHAHQNQEHRGEIQLSNGGRFGGSVFQVKLP